LRVGETKDYRTTAERSYPMATCPHLVIGMGGRCEWCFEVVVEKPVPPSNSRIVEPLSAELLSARWAARFGEPDDYQKAIEALHSKGYLP
jgi:hypothetical protein